MMKRLAGYEKNSTIPLAVLTKCKNVTDRRTDGQDGQTDNRVRTSRSYNGSHMDHVTITQLHISAGIHWIAPPPQNRNQLTYQQKLSLLTMSLDICPCVKLDEITAALASGGTPKISDDL